MLLSVEEIKSHATVTTPLSGVSAVFEKSPNQLLVSLSVSNSKKRNRREDAG